MSTTYPALRGVMGDWVYYSILMSPEQVAQTILRAKDIREDKGLDDHLQRELADRVEKIRKYLVTRGSRFFNSMIVGVFGGMPDWIEFDLLGPHSSLHLSQEELASIKASVGLLRLTGEEKMFAIDGQHRTEAIRSAWSQRARPVRPVGSRLDIGDDQYSVILVAHIDDSQGKKRTRRLFADINKRAVSVSQGDLAIIDEDDWCAIAARRLYAEYPYFHLRGKSIISLTPKANLDPKDTAHFTNLLTLVSINKKLSVLAPKVRGRLLFEEENVLALQQVATAFFDFVIEHVPSLKSFFRKRKSLLVLRESEMNVLFRPVGLVLLARLYGHFVKSGKLPVLGEKLRMFDYALDGVHFNNILWNGRLEVKNKSLAFQLCLYLLGELGVEDTAKLKGSYRLAHKNDKAELPHRL